MHMTVNDWKDRLGIVYSTNKDFEYVCEADEEVETLPPVEQRLRVRIEKAGRKGKIVTTIEGFVGKSDDLKTLSKILKTRLSVGGSEKDGIIILQGDCKGRVTDILKIAGYVVKG